MIELLGTWLMTYDSGFDVFRYLTVRTIGGTLTALMLSIFLGPALIRFLTHIQFSQSIRGDGPKSHLSKSGTPTMGGLIIISSLIISTLLWSDFKNPYICFALPIFKWLSFTHSTCQIIALLEKRYKGMSNGLSADIYFSNTHRHCLGNTQ